MFKKSLIGSVIFHLLLCAGLELISKDPDNRRIAQRPSSLLMVTLDSDIPSETPVFLKERVAGNDGQRKTLIRSEQAVGLSVAEETPPAVLTDSENMDAEIAVTGSGETEVGAKNFFGIESSGSAGNVTIGPAGNRQSEDSFLQVDCLPVKIYAPAPNYPFAARKNNWEGVTVLKVLIQANGRIGAVTVLESSGYQLLDKSAVKAVKKWRYQPAFKDGTAIVCQAQVRIKFVLEDEHAVDN